MASCTCAGSPSSSAERACERGVLGEHAVHLPVTGESEREPDANPVKRRVPGAQAAHA